MALLTIYGRLPNLNDYVDKCRTNRFAGATMKREAEKIITSYIKEQIPDIHYKNTVVLDFRWYEKNTRRDLDNVCFAKKFILDALVTNGTIVADDWKGVIGFTDKFFVDPKNPRIEVEFYER